MFKDFEDLNERFEAERLANERVKEFGLLSGVVCMKMLLDRDKPLDRELPLERHIDKWSEQATYTSLRRRGRV